MSLWLEFETKLQRSHRLWILIWLIQSRQLPKPKAISSKKAVKLDIQKICRHKEVMHVCEGEKERKNENIWGGFKRIQKCLQRQERRLGMKISMCLQEKGKWTNKKKDQSTRFSIILLPQRKVTKFSSLQITNIRSVVITRSASRHWVFII